MDIQLNSIRAEWNKNRIEQKCNRTVYEQKSTEYKYNTIGADQITIEIKQKKIIETQLNRNSRMGQEQYIIELGRIEQEQNRIELNRMKKLEQNRTEWSKIGENRIGAEQNRTSAGNLRLKYIQQFKLHGTSYIYKVCFSLHCRHGSVMLQYTVHLIAVLLQVSLINAIIMKLQLLHSHCL